MGECGKSPTIITQQMKVFTKRSATWWDKNSTAGTLHKYDEFVFDQMKKVLQERCFISDANVALKNFKLLDAGCGGGLLSEQFTRMGCTVAGIDVNESLINVAKQHQTLDSSSLGNLSYSWETIEDHAARNPGKYDVVVLNFVLQHAKHRETLIRSCIQALRPGGIFFVTAANKTIAGWLRVVLLEQIIHGILPKNSHSWKMLYPLSKLRTVLAQSKSSTIIPQQMQLFTKRSATWWDKNSAIGILHKYDELVFDQMKKVLREKCFISDANVALKNFKLLDAGCGGGLLSEQFARMGCTVAGIDVNESLITVAKQHQTLDSSSLGNLSYSWETIEDHAARNPGKYDVVVLNFVLQHAKHRETLVRSCIQALRPGGIFFATAANKTIAGWLRIVLLDQIIHGIMPKNSHSWKMLYPLSKLRTVLAQNACVVKEYRGLIYCRDTSLIKWVDDTSGFYFVYAIKE